MRRWTSWASTARRGAMMALIAVGIPAACEGPRRPAPTSIAQPATRRAATTRKAAGGPAVIEMRRGTGSFPLGEGAIASTQQLVACLDEGFRLRVTPMRGGFVQAEGTFPNLRSLRVDLSEAKVNSAYRPAKFEKKARDEGDVQIGSLDYVANPLRYDTSAVRVRLQAKDAHLALQSDTKGNRGLVLIGAQRGMLSFAMSAADINAFFLAGGRQGLSGSGVALDDLRMSFVNDDSRSLQAVVHVKARWLLVPMAFRMTGRVDADDAGNLKYSHLGCEGEDPGGDLVATFLRPSIKKMDVKTVPLVSFVDPETHVMDVRFSVEDGVKMTIDFGR